MSQASVSKEVVVLDKTFEVYISEKEILSAVENMVQRVAEDLGDCCPVFLGVLDGAFMFMSDFIRRYPYPCELSFTKMSSYSGTESTGNVKTLIGLNKDLKGRTVVILEDIVDTGNTMEELLAILRAMGIEDVRIATIFFKPDSFVKDFPIDYVGMEIENKFIVGYGLDYDGLGRNLPDVYQLKDDK